MELVQELFVTASLALVLSLFVAKLVSMAMAGDAGPREWVSMNRIVDEGIGTVEVKSGERLIVQGSKSERKVEFFVEQKVDEFEGESFQVEKVVEIHNHSREIKEERGEFPVISTDERLGEEADVGGLTARVWDDKSGEDIVLAEKKVDDFPGKSLEENTSEEVSANNIDESAQQRIDNREPTEEIGVELWHEREILPRTEENRVVGESELKEEPLDFDEDEWEGIERSELEKVFLAASKFITDTGSVNKDLLAGIGNDEQMELYSLHKVATEGPCHEPQPMALKVSARAKWNAWQRLGNMSPEAAMEEYITLLSDRVPEWMEDNSTGKSQPECTSTGLHKSATPDLSTSLSHLPNLISECNEPELKFGAKEGDLTITSDLANKARK
ncbi:Acyl-CoA-binding domain-containing protein [Quillaja saponaria]|uniref:Acyl-CoA-binding domain-containing protein n=1 Tax=Quillaja saponaria TaxID=32244 RepID=A0AAD7LHW8_QUISA|nr:Acyl-CoA-binding domain-containing protein [Quillaja saponaria]